MATGELNSSYGDLGLHLFIFQLEYVLKSKQLALSLLVATHTREVSIQTQ